ncbi:unnamed protein product [Symbiodinium natans]|uniref:Uncharacterized protein n=1 Tax=Symbiodinium natans TaxID=878477 RepID=A0A812PWR3_9DINO|nr:unnamed protein product [Symbiodinium natans]
MSLACGPEQFAVLPTLAVSGAVVVATVAYRTSIASRGGREREWRKRRAGELLGEETNAVEPKAVGRSRAPQEKQKERESSAQLSNRSAARAIHEDRVVLIDREGYLAARAHLRLVTSCLVGASIAAAAQPGGSDMIFALSRFVLLLLLTWEAFQSAAGRIGSCLGLLSLEQQRLAPATPLLGTAKRRGSGAETLLSQLGPASASMQSLDRLRLAALHCLALALLIWFEVVRHPELRTAACEGHEASAAALLTERASALTMVVAWLFAALTRTAAWRCEACVWLAPRAEEVLSEYIESDRGCPLAGRALDLAEALCAEPRVADAWLRELSGLSLLVMDGASQIRPSPGIGPGSVELGELGELQRDVQVELQRFSDATEARFEELLAATEALCQRAESTTKPVEGAAKVRRKTSKGTREQLLKTKLDSARGLPIPETSESRGKPSDSGSSSEAPNREAADAERIQADFAASRGSLAQLLEQALKYETSKQSQPQEAPPTLGLKPSALPDPWSDVTARATQGVQRETPRAQADLQPKEPAGSSVRSESQGSSVSTQRPSRGPKRYAEMRLYCRCR